jgi:hypothetical protein
MDTTQGVVSLCKIVELVLQMNTRVLQLHSIKGGKMDIVVKKINKFHNDTINVKISMSI